MQDLNQYIDRIIATPDHPTATSLLLSSPLVSTLRSMIERSEGEIVEYGTNLFWLHDQLTSLELIQGRGAEAVDLGTKDVKLELDYIGDCHTHPYLLKMGPEATVGPSSGDYMEWWVNPPASFQTAVHFVLSGRAVFLIVVRGRTAMGGHSFRELNIEADTTVINDPIREAEIEVGMQYAAVRDTREELAFWKDFDPAMGGKFARQNQRMNTEMANALHFEYYVGNLRNGTVSLNLVSNRVYSHLPVGLTLEPPDLATWLPDSSATSCWSCNRAFTFTRRKHHCRRCGHIFCGRCTSQTARVRNRLTRWGSRKAGVKVARVCDDCHSRVG